MPGSRKRLQYVASFAVDGAGFVFLMTADAQLMGLIAVFIHCHTLTHTGAGFRIQIT